jgi:hypothetical protein
LRQSEKEEKNSAVSRRPSYLPSEISLLVALLFFTTVNLIYAENKSDYQTSSGSAYYPDLTLIFLVLGAAFLTISIVGFLRIESRKPLTIDSQSRVRKSLGAIVAEAIFQNRGVLTLIAVAYGLVFAFIDGILIYQPTIDFGSNYGVTVPTSVVENCCGPPGYVPVGLVYFPAQHLGIELIPLSLMIMVLVSVLVGVNVALLLESVRISRPMKMQKSGNSFVGGIIGAAFGVFSGCPTCAAAFFLSMIAGSGATAFSFTISELQPAIILISIPLLFFSIVWQARSIRTILLGCKI